MSDLFRLTVLLDVPGSSLTFLFKAVNLALESAARVEAAMGNKVSTQVYDDFGTRCQLHGAHVIAVNLADLGRQMEGEGEAAILHAIKQAEAQKKANADVRLNSGLLVPGVGGNGQYKGRQ